MDKPKLISVYLFVSNIDDSLRFYNALGLDVEKVSDVLGRAFADGEVILEFGTKTLTSSYDPKYQTPPPVAKGSINLQWPSFNAVDETYARMVAEGFVGHLAPCTPPWQSRLAILLDPDGNQIGLHSTRDLAADRRRE